MGVFIFVSWSIVASPLAVAEFSLVVANTRNPKQPLHVINQPPRFCGIFTAVPTRSVPATCEHPHNCFCLTEARLSTYSWLPCLFRFGCGVSNVYGSDPGRCIRHTIAYTRPSIPVTTSSPPLRHATPHNGTYDCMSGQEVPPRIRGSTLATGHAGCTHRAAFCVGSPQAPTASQRQRLRATRTTPTHQCKQTHTARTLSVALLIFVAHQARFHR